MRIFLAILWTAIIGLGLGIPLSNVGKIGFDGIDKVIHFGLFFIFGYLWMVALDRPIGRRTAIVFSTGVFFALATEIFQAIMPIDRSGDPADVVADVIGLIAGIAVYRFAHHLFASPPPDRMHFLSNFP